MTLLPSSDPPLTLVDLQAIIDSSSDCIKVLDLDARLLSMNAGGMEVMEIPDFHVCQYALWPTFWTGDARAHVERALDAARVGHSTTFEGATPTFAGTPKWWEVRVSPLLASDGTVTRVLAISRDITVRKTAEQGLREAQQLLQQRAQTLEVRVGQQERALEAFVRFTTQVASSTDLTELATAAGDVIQDAVSGATSGLYLIQGPVAVPLAFSRNTPEAVRVARQGGVPLTTPLVAEALGTRRTAFAEGDDGRVQSVGYASALSVTPYFSDGRPFALFATGAGRPQWTAQEQAIIESIGRGLGLALERAEQTRQLQERTDEEVRRNQALTAFAVMSRDLANETDRYALVHRAQEIMLSLLSPGYALYWEQAPDHWQLKSQVGDIGNPDLQRLVDDHGLPLDAPALHSTWLTGIPNYQDNYAQGADTPAEMIRHVNAATAFQVRLYGQPIGMLAIGLFDQRVWTPMDKVLLETSITSLGLALERAEQTQKLQERTAGLDAFVAFTEAVGTELDVHRLARQATDVTEAQLKAVSVAYYERHGDLWNAVVWSENVRPDVVAQIRRGVPLDAPNFAEAVQSGAVVFSDGWNAEDNHLPTAGMYGAAAFYPIFINNDAQAILSIGKLDGVTWTERERGIVRAVGQSLGLSLERAEQARALMEQRDALNRRTRELTAANEELEAFTYSASHDMRTPIRHVMGFSDLALSALDKGDPEKVRRNLGVVKQGAARMDQLINGMLMLSRAGRQDFQPRWVALDVLITQALQDVQLEFPAQIIEAREPPPVQVWGDATLIQQVMTNLVSNAVKYSSGQSRSEIDVQVQESDSEWVITVRDNGVGFDPKYAGKLFGIFQRLHTQAAFPGVGVGLATVRRIVLKHGGRVFADSVEGVGATFGVTLPRPLQG